MRKFLIGAFLAAFVCLPSLYAQKEIINTTGELNEFGATGSFIKTYGKPVKQNWTVFLSDDGKILKARINNSEVRELFVDGDRIPQSEFSDFTPELDRILEKVRLRQQLEAESQRLNEREAQLERELQKVEKAWFKLEELKQKYHQIEKERFADLSFEKDELAGLMASNSKLRTVILKQRAEFSRERNDNYERFAQVNPELEIAPVLKKIISDLKDEGIVTGTEDISFKLSNHELIVNGRRQSAEIHQRLKPKYVIDAPYETGFVYHWKHFSQS